MATHSNLTAGIADRVAASILRAGKTYAEVSDETGIPYSTLGRKLRGHTDFTIPELVRVASAVGCSWSTYLPEPDQDASPALECEALSA